MKRHQLLAPYLLLIGLGYQWILPTQSYGGETIASDTANYFRVIWGLLVVLGIILILYGLLKKRFSLLTTNSNQEINVVEIKPLMGKKALCLISVRGQDHLLGISGDKISHLADLTKKSESSFAEVMKSTEAPSEP